LLLIALEHRGSLARGNWARRRYRIWRRRLLIAAGLVLLALPVCIPLFTGSVLWGHDGFVYFPRLVEFTRTSRTVVLPRWAPDLGRRTGQPLFLFHPPMIYYFENSAPDWVRFRHCHERGLRRRGAAFGGCHVPLASLYFGDAGGLAGAAAYLCAVFRRRSVRTVGHGRVCHLSIFRLPSTDLARMPGAARLRIG
jgi:hypothetical protein